MSDRPIYLDNHATTPMDPRVLEYMLPFFVKEFGNPSSKIHSYGWKAAQCVEDSRLSLARCLGAHPEEFIFTSAATESNNAAIKGAACRRRSKGNHIICSAIEHKSVLDTCDHLTHEGFEVSYIKPNSDGIIAPS